MTYLAEAKETQFGYSLDWKDFVRLNPTNRTHFLHDFVYQSNRIEGISDHYGHTIPKGAPIIIPPKLRSHERAFDYVVEQTQRRQRPETRKIERIHEILMEEILLREDRGHLRKTRVKTTLKTGEQKNYPNPTCLPSLMKSYQESLGELTENPTVTQEDLLENHAYFEWIHPFADGNGRTGRLLLNWLSLLYRNEFYVIESAKREEYLDFLEGLETQFNRKHPKIVKKLR